MLYLVLGLVVFYAIHSVRMVAPQFRVNQIETFGESGWKGIYSILSLGGLALIVLGWSIYRPMAPVIYVSPDWMRYLTALFVLVAFVFIASANMPPGRIKTFLVHPFLVGVMLWSLGHLLVNGDLASIILFGSFFVYAVWNRAAVSRRDDARPAYAGPRGDIIAVIAGVLLFAVFVAWLHAFLFGVSPLY